jgi:hypothetical protein
LQPDPSTGGLSSADSALRRFIKLMNENPENIAFGAALLHCGFRLGYFSRQDIEHWADRQIEEQGQPSLELIELAILRGKHDMDVLALLSQASADLGPRLWIELTIGVIRQLYRDGRASLEWSIRELYLLARERQDDVLTKAEMGAIYRLDDGYDLAVSHTYGTVKEVENHFLTFTEPYLTTVRDAESRMVGQKNAQEELGACPNHP